MKLNRIKRPLQLGSLLFALVFLSTLPGAAAAPDPVVTSANVMVEIGFEAARFHADPFNDITLDVVFTDSTGAAKRVPAFWAGGHAWKVRYVSPLTGSHRYRTECSDPRDAGLQDVRGVVEVKPYVGDNPLYRHGPIRVADDHRHFAHADGTPFFWLGDTWWMGLCRRLHWPDEFQQLTADRKAKGFNVIQIVAGLYPDMPAFDPRGANETGFPWETNYARIRPEYFDAADVRLRYLVEQGLTPCIVAAWGYHLPWLGVDKMKQHLRYVIARYGALPVVWCAAGEVNLPFYQTPGFPYGGQKQTADWANVIRYSRSINVFGRMVTAHPTGLPPLSGRGLFPDQDLLDFDMLQTGHGMRDTLVATVETLRRSYAAKPVMPVINAEVCYEALLGRIPAEIPRLMFWASMMSGAAGHTYGANGLWQVNRRDAPYGKSPGGNNWGTTPWDEAMNLPGSRQLGLTKRLFEEKPWYQCTPHPEWAAFDAAPTVGLSGSDWIWFPEGDPTRDAPAERRYFRRQFTVSADHGVRRAALRVSVDDRFTVYVNGRELGIHADWHSGRIFMGLESLLQAGRNVVAVEAENLPTAGTPNPAGLIAALSIEYADGSRDVVKSDAAWRCAKQKAAGWNVADFDDSAWQSARTLGRYGCGPWGQLGGEQPYEIPYVMGIPGRLRFVYVPLPQPIEVRQLEPGSRYQATRFDPVTGQRHDLGLAEPDSRGAWRCAAPTPGTHDWVIILERQGK